MNRIFDFKLYKESIRQTRLIGFILGGVILAISMILKIGAVVDYHWRASAGFSPRVTTLFFMETTLLLWIFMYLAPLFMVMKLFAFMNKRSASDFYHATPHTRKSLFISFLAGIFTWIIGTVVVVTLLSAIVFAFLPTVNVATSTLVFSFLGFLAGTFLVTSGILLAKGLSGTWLSNLAVAAIILFYPRLILMIFNNMFMDITRIIHPGDTNLLTNINYNIAFSIFDFYYSFIWYGWTYLFMNVSIVGSIIYTFVLAFIYLFLAGFLFTRRKSEVAEKGATNRIIQHAIRCMLVFPITLAIPSIILSVRRITWNPYDTVGIVAIVFISLVVYFVYELIVTRKLINVIKAIPSLGIVVFFNVLFIFLLVVGRNGVWNNVPVADEIAGVRIVTQIHSNSSYNEVLTHDLYVNHPESNGMVEVVFRENVRRARGRSADDIRFFNAGTFIGVSIQMEDGSTMMRNLRFEGDLGDDFRSLRFLDDVYAEKATRLPVIDEDTPLSFGVTGWSSGGGTDIGAEPVEYEKINEVWDEVHSQVWEIYTQELNELSMIEQAFHVGMIRNRPDENIISAPWYFRVRGTVEQRRFSSSYRLTNLTPNTVEFIMNVINEAFESEMETFIHKIIDGANLYGGVNDPSLVIGLEEMMRVERGAEVFSFCFCYSCNEERRDYGRGEDELEEIREVLRVIMEDSFWDKLSVDENLYRLEIREGGNASVIVFINITEENRSRINEILEIEEE